MITVQTTISTMLSLLLLSVILAITGSSDECNTTVTTASGTRAPKNICSGDLIFNEEFNKFDFHTWSHEKTLTGGGNWEFEVYLNNRSNSYVRNGNLYIKPTLTSDKYGEDFLYHGTISLYSGEPADKCTNPSSWGCERRGTRTHVLNPITSARIRTAESFSFCYGRAEIRAKLPAGDWIWPAIWMLPRYSEYGSWPSSGEIDIMEGRGNRNLMQNGRNIGTELSSSTLHFGPFYTHDAYYNAHFERQTTSGQGYHQDFHLYQMEWTEDYMKFSIDNEEIGRIIPPEGGFWEIGQFNSSLGPVDNPWKYGSKMAPFDKEFYFVLNVAVGGVNHFFPDNAENPGGKPWNNTSNKAATDFWNGREQWLPTWQRDVNNGENSALQVDYIKVWAL